MKKNKLNLTSFNILLIIILLTVGFTNRLSSPKTLYRVYLEGKSLGLIESKKELEEYINKKKQKIKKKYNVKKVYVPDELDIQKEITYNNKVISIKKIYEKIKDISPFTIDGYTITIKGIDTTDTTGKTIKGKNQKIYVLEKDIFTEAVDATVKSFISEEDYEAYEKDKQEKITDTGKIIESIYIENTITIKKSHIPVNKTIYTEKEELSKYLLFGTTKDQQKYAVKEGDTIEDVAFANKISNEEFLIANPNFTDANSLLYPGQIVTLGILKPQFNVVEEDHVVSIEEKNYETETRYDNSKYVGYQEVAQAGVKGQNRVTQKVKKVNGQIVNIVPVGNPEVIKEPIKEIIVKGGRQSNYSGGGYGTVVATKGQWGWPASCSSVSSNFGWRWGTLHDGTDIAGCGYGSNIFAAAAGTVVESKKKTGYYKGGYGDNGEYIIIDHHNGYYTIYAHLCPGCRYVKAGDNVVKGQVIGGMGNTGAATGVHLHFGMWNGYPYYGGRALNAMSFY